MKRATFNFLPLPTYYKYTLLSNRDRAAILLGREVSEEFEYSWLVPSSTYYIPMYYETVNVYVCISGHFRNTLR